MPYLFKSCNLFATFVQMNLQHEVSEQSFRYHLLHYLARLGCRQMKTHPWICLVAGSCKSAYCIITHVFTHVLPFVPDWIIVATAVNSIRTTQRQKCACVYVCKIFLDSRMYYYTLGVNTMLFLQHEYACHPTTVSSTLILFSLTCSALKCRGGPLS